MKLEMIKEKLNMSFYNNAERGVINSIDFQISSLKIMFMEQYYLTIILAESMSQDKFKELKKYAGATGLFLSSAGNFNNNVLNVYIRNVDKTLDKFNKVVTFLEENKLETLKTDIFGSNKEIDDYREVSVKYMRTNYYLNLVIPVNKESVSKIYETEKEVLDKEDLENNNITSGILFAILGAFIGTIPSIVVYHIGYILWPLYLIVPFLAFLFYKIGKGPQKGYVPYLIGTISVVVSILALLYTWYSMAVLLDTTISDLFASEEIREGMIKDLTFVLIGNLVGIFSMYKYIQSKTTSGKRKDLENLK